MDDMDRALVVDVSLRNTDMIVELDTSHKNISLLYQNYTCTEERMGNISNFNSFFSLL